VDRAEAVAALNDPRRRDEACRALVEARDRSAIPDLVRAYDRPGEASRVPLLDALDTLGGVERARELAASSVVEERRLAARMMDLLPDEGHVEPLAALVSDPDEAVARLARRALAHQRRTPAWHELVERLRASPDPELREWSEAR
jgi:HEAT repeat protein